MTIGFSDKGGGYVNYVDIDGSGNINGYGFGRGWQSSVRDRLHNGRYNPTQAGFVDAAGAPTSDHFNRYQF